MKKYFNFLKALINKDLILDYRMVALKRERRLKIPSITSYIRVNTLELVANEIHENNVSGSVAEVGVYKGEFARLLSVVFPKRTLYLFDTFEGFDNKDINIDVNKDFSEGNQDFSDTSIELVLNKLANKNKAIVKKGWFPESLGGLEEQFCFVSLDADLYKPIYAGLEYFYPRLSRGGYIFVHDYNNDEYKGAKEAVKEFCSKYGVSFVPMSDSWGSAVISK